MIALPSHRVCKSNLGRSVSRLRLAWHFTSSLRHRHHRRRGRPRNIGHCPRTRPGRAAAAAAATERRQLRERAPSGQVVLGRFGDEVRPADPRQDQRDARRPPAAASVRPGHRAVPAAVLRRDADVQRSELSGGGRRPSLHRRRGIVCGCPRPRCEPVAPDVLPDADRLVQSGLKIEEAVLRLPALLAQVLGQHFCPRRSLLLLPAWAKMGAYLSENCSCCSSPAAEWTRVRVQHSRGSWLQPLARRSQGAPNGALFEASIIPPVASRAPQQLPMLFFTKNILKIYGCVQYYKPCTQEHGHVTDTNVCLCDTSADQPWRRTSGAPLNSNL